MYKARLESKMSDAVAISSQLQFDGEASRGRIHDGMSNIIAWFVYQGVHFFGSLLLILPNGNRLNLHQKLMIAKFGGNRMSLGKETFIRSDPSVLKAAAKLELLRGSASNNRWGEARRFAGQRASNRLEKIQRAEQAWSRAYDRAEKLFNRAQLRSALPLESDARNGVEG